MKPIVTPDVLAGWMNKKAITIIDVRSVLQDPDKGEGAYKKAHIPGAFYWHLEHDLSGEVQSHGGNHPLPLSKTFIAKLEELGLKKDSPVVVYDAANDMFAARAWFLLHYFGHEAVYVLDGGFKAWEAAGYTVTTTMPDTPTRTVWDGKEATDITVTMEQVKASNRMGMRLLDARAPERYRGEKEPLYDKAGHIPGAVNYFWQDVLKEDGSYKTVEQLQEHFRGLPKEQEIIVSCGSGISACPNYLALKMAGFKQVRLYPGSYSDWISYPSNDVETEISK